MESKGKPVNINVLIEKCIDSTIHGQDDALENLQELRAVFASLVHNLVERARFCYDSKQESDWHQFGSWQERSARHERAYLELIGCLALMGAPTVNITEAIEREINEKWKKMRG